MRPCRCIIPSSSHPISDEDLRYFSSSYRLSRKSVVLFPLGFLEHFVCSVVHLLPHGWSMSGSPGIEAFLICCRTFSIFFESLMSGSGMSSCQLVRDADA